MTLSFTTHAGFSPAHQTIGLCRLFERACGPRSLMRNCGLHVGQVANQVANLRPIANRPGRVTTLGQAGWHVIFSTLSPSPEHDRPQIG
jgi:hypothetical protein